MMRLTVSLLSMLLLLAGCSSRPTPKVYLLGDPPAPTAGAWPQLGRPIVQIQPVSVPDYLDTRDILIRSDRNEVRASPTGRWAERLSVGLTHALTTALLNRLPATDVTASKPITMPARQILVDVEGFEVQPDGRCLLIARWTVATGDGRRVVRSERATLIEQAAGVGDAAIAAAMTRAIDRLADRIAPNKSAL